MTGRHDTTPTDEERAWARSMLACDDMHPADLNRAVRMATALGVAEVALKHAIAGNDIDARTIARARAITEALREDQ